MQLPPNPADPVLCLAFSPAGKKLGVGRRNNLVEVWDVNQKKVVQQFKYPGPVYTLSFSRDGARLACSGSTKIAVFDVALGLEVPRLFDSKDGPPASQPNVAALVVAPDGKTLAAGCYDAVIRLFDFASGKENRALEGHGHVPFALAFSADGRILASAGFDKTVRLWEAFSGSPITTFKGHQGPVNALAFLRNGRGVFSGSADTTILLWDATGQAKDGVLRMLSLTPPELQAAWHNLASEDASKAHPSLWQLVASGKESASYLGGQVYLVDPKFIDQLFLDLNSDVFKVRHKATNELEKYGRWMEGRIKEALKNPPTLEVQRRLDALLAKLNVPGSLSLHQEHLRLRRIMMVLEQVAIPQAITVLEKLTNGAPAPDLQQEARASLERLRKKWEGDKVTR